MRRAGTALLLALAALPAWGAGRQPAQSAQRELARQQAEVERLRRQVAGQEAGSAEADRQLKQKDQAIADLQRQLEALRGKPAAASSRP
jgi:septal ring factor EnvC (AmiA/AmiB activator)